MTWQLWWCSSRCLVLSASGVVDKVDGLGEEGAGRSGVIRLISASWTISIVRQLWEDCVASNLLRPMSSEANTGHSRPLTQSRAGEGSGQLGGNKDAIPVSQGRDDAMHRR